MKTTVLIVEDNSINRQLLHGILKNEYKIMEAENGARALELLSDSHNVISLVLLDLVMPVMDGYATLAEIRKNPKFASLPVIITTASTETGAEIKALSMGANEYITKPYTPLIIINRIRNTIKFYESAALINSLTRDQLTGLYNREGFFDEAKKRILTHAPGHYVLSCMDIDNFKVLNDLFGTEKGDCVLRHIADICKKGFDAIEGICGRLSVDDFVALYPSKYMDSEAIKTIRNVSSRPDVTMPQLFIKTGRYMVDDLSLSLSTMYDRAVLALQSVKGRHDIHIAHYEESMRESVLRYQSIVNDMNHALQDGQFEAWFQPQFNHATGALIGAEALVRWRHPKRGIIPPSEFIPIFENNGFIYEMDKNIWEQICVCMRRWIDEKRSLLPVSVNISRYDLLRDDIVDVLVGLIGRYNIPVELLRLEITESAFANMPERIVTIVRRFIAYGFTVEIDDFGSGYSSLNTLKDVPAHILKLDMRFLKGDETDRGGNILESIVRMSKWLDIPVIAEGVETLSQANFLKSIGCSYVQGFLYSKPMPVEEYESLMDTSRREEKLIAMEPLVKLDNNAFWNPASMDSVIFSSYVGSACIFECREGKIELLRATDKYVQMFDSPDMTIEKALKLNWEAHLDKESWRTIQKAVELSQSTGNEQVGEFVLLNLPGCRKKICLRTTLRVLAVSGNRRLVYCINENITAQREAERKEAESVKRLSAIMNNMDGGVSAITINDGVAHFVFTNERFYSILGYTREQFDAEVHNAFDVIYPDDRERIRNTISDVLQFDGKASYEYRSIRRNGEIVHLRGNIAVTELAGIRDKVLLEVTSDITDAVTMGRLLTETGGQLQFLNDIAHDLLAQPEVDEGINRVLGKVLDYFGGDRAYVIEMDREHLTSNNTYEVCAPGVVSEKDNLQNIPREDTPYWWSALDSGNYINIKDCDSLRGNRTGERCLLERQGIKTLVAVPLKRDGESIGFVGVDNPVCQQNHLEHLRAIGDYLTVMLTRRDLSARLKDDNRMIHEIMSDMPGGLVRMRLFPDGSVVPVYVNAGFSDIVGMSAQEIMAAYSENVLWGVHPDDMETLRSLINEMTRTGKKQSVEYRLRHGNGGWVWVRVLGCLTKNDAGDRFINVYYTDLSEQEKLEREAKTVLSHVLSAIMNSATDLVFAKDRNFRYICCSPAFVKFARQKKQEDVIGKTDYDFWTKEEADHFRRDDERLFENESPLEDYIELVPSEDGLPHYCNTSKYILRNTEGEIIGLYGIGRDVTETRAASEQLRLLTDSIQGGIATYTLTPEGIRLVYSNRGMGILFDQSQEEYAIAVKEDVLAKVHAEDVPALQAQLERIIKDGTPIDCTYRHLMPDGGIKWINIRANPAEKMGGLPQCYAVFYDVTEQKQAEENARIHEAEIRLAMTQMGKKLCEYDPATRVLTLPPAYSFLYALPQSIPDVPESVIQSGIIDPETQDAYRGFYDAILRGDSTGSVEYRTRCQDGTLRWENVEFSSIFDSMGKPVKTIISVEETTSQHMRYELEKARPRLGEEKLLVHALFNLNTGETLDYAYRDGREVPVAERTAFLFGGDNLDSIIINSEERAHYRALNDPAKLLEQFDAGKTEFSIDYRRTFPGGDVIWVRNILRMVRRPGGRDVLLFEYCYDMDEEKLHELLLTMLINVSYDYVAKVHGGSRRFSIITKTGNQQGMPPRQGNDMDCVVHLLCDTIVHPDDRENTLQNTLVEGMKRNLADRELFQFSCREIQPDGSLRYKRFTEYYLDREADTIILIREDVTALMLAETEKTSC